MNICVACKESKPEDEFYWKDKAQTKRQEYCKACKAKYNKVWYQKNKAKHMANVVTNNKARAEFFYKMIAAQKDVPCADCGKKYPPHVMDFDHLEGHEKAFDVSKMVGYNMQRIAAEIMKCEVVCANCHRERTHKRRTASKV